MIILKTSEEIEIMARASRVVAETLAMLRRRCARALRRMN